MRDNIKATLILLKEVINRGRGEYMNSSIRCLHTTLLLLDVVYFTIVLLTKFTAVNASEAYELRIFSSLSGINDMISLIANWLRVCASIFKSDAAKTDFGTPDSILSEGLNLPSMNTM